MTGQTFAHYTLLEKLGEAATGAVYKARDTRLHRLVARKLLTSCSTADGEAQAASSLNHPSIVTIHDVNQARGEMYIEMELVAKRVPSGESRQDRLRTCRTPAGNLVWKAHAETTHHG